MVVCVLGNGRGRCYIWHPCPCLDDTWVRPCHRLQRTDGFRAHEQHMPASSVSTTQYPNQPTHPTLAETHVLGHPRVGPTQAHQRPPVRARNLELSPGESSGDDVPKNTRKKCSHRGADRHRQCHGHTFRRRPR